MGAGTRVVRRYVGIPFLRGERAKPVFGGAPRVRRDRVSPTETRIRLRRHQIDNGTRRDRRRGSGWPVRSSSDRRERTELPGTAPTAGPTRTSTHTAATRGTRLSSIRYRASLTSGLSYGCDRRAACATGLSTGNRRWTRSRSWNTYSGSTTTSMRFSMQPRIFPSSSERTMRTRGCASHATRVFRV